MNGFDRVADGEDNWSYGPRLLPRTPQEFTESLWSEVKALKCAISMPRQKVRNLINAIEQGKVSDEEFAMLQRLVEKRGRDAAQVIGTPVDIVQHCSPRPQTPEPLSDVCVSLKSSEGKVDPERDELESPSAGTGVETPGQQCYPIWETGRTTATGFLAAGVGPNLGKHTSPTTERVDTRDVRTTTTTSAASNITFLQQGYKPKDKDKGSEGNKQFDPGGKEEKPPPCNAAVILFLFFRGRALGHGRPAVCTSCFLSVCVFLLVLYLLFLSGDHFSASWKT